MSIAPAFVVHDTRTVPYSAWGRKARREGGGLYYHARGTSPDRGCLSSHSIIRSVLRHDGRFWGVPISVLQFFRRRNHALVPATPLFGVVLDPTNTLSERRRNRRRPGECRAGLIKYAAARPLFALRAGRMAASGIICRGRFLGSDVALTRAPKVPPIGRSAFTYSKFPGVPTKYRSEVSPSEDTFWGTARRRGLLYFHARGS